ncbi:MAG: FAD-dependent oxidoreductase [Saprospiraceae bacterium]|nr:FAD-dependent oxidoreductase [Saprospiraceae bacterium]
MNYSFWEKYFIESPSDITIIGSGIVGVSTAISIKEKLPHLDVKIIERGSQPYGASTKNAGFACFGSVSELLDDFIKMGENPCMEVVHMRWEGLKKLRARLGDQIMEYKNGGGMELFRNGDEQIMDECLGKITFCNEMMADHLGISKCYTEVKNDKVHRLKKEAIFNAYEGTINPVSMMNQLIKKAILLGVHLINGIAVDSIDRTNKKLMCASGLQINYGTLIVCTNGFAAQLLPELPVVPARNQVLMTSPITDLNLTSAYHVDKGYIYFRQYEQRILLGGGRNIDPITESTDEFGNTEIIRKYLLSFLDTIHPGSSDHVVHWWSGILGVGDSKFPVCKWVGDDVLVGVRLGGMGVAIGSYLGDKLASEVAES